MLTIYALPNCDTCRAAVKWLRAHQLPFVEKSIRETPPSIAELRAMLGHVHGDLKRLCNTAGNDFRAMNLKDRLPVMKEADALALLASNGGLVKRPFLLGPGVGFVGFNEATWHEALGQS